MDGPSVKGRWIGPKYIASYEKDEKYFFFHKKCELFLVSFPKIQTIPEGNSKYLARD